MILAFRSIALAAGAAALLSSQAVYAAPAKVAPAFDPLVSLSVFGTAQSRAAICAAGTSAAAAGAAASFAQAPAPGCLLPLTGQAPPPVVTEAGPPPPPPPPPPGPGIGTLPLLLGLAAIVALAALLLLSDDDDDGGLTPISPA